MIAPTAKRPSRSLRTGRIARSAVVVGCVLTGLLGTGACWKAASVEHQPSSFAQAIFAAPDGSARGNGSRERPFDLETALAGAARPGWTVWLRGGTYRVGAITSTLAGTEHAPITVRSVPGEAAVIDGVSAVGAVLTLNGAWTLYRDFEVTNSNPWRSGGVLNRAVGIDVHGANVKLVNLVVHDLAGGLGIWSDAVDAEAYGNIIYYNGWLGADRPHGHGIYTQNKTGVRRITDNVIFGQFGIGIHAYASDEGFLDDVQLEGNVVVNNGITAGDFNILIGGHRLAKRPVVKSNYTYDNPGAGNNVGYAAGCADAVVKDNYFVVARGGYAMQLVNCTGVLEGNVLIGGSRAVAGPSIVPQPELAAQHPANDFAVDRPTVTKTVVRPNRYSPGRAHVIVYNWEQAKDVQVDLSPAAIPVGASFEIRDVRSLSTRPIVAGAYTGRAVTIPLEGLTAAHVIGWEPTPPHTAPEFAVFLVTSGSAAPSTFASVIARMRGLVGI
jgi:hypothetical protein